MEPARPSPRVSAAPSMAPPVARPAGVALTPAEVERTAMLFALLLLAALILVVGRSARDALFLTRFPVTWIAPMWIAYAITSGTAAVAYARFASRLSRARTVVGFALISAASYLVLRVLIGHDVRAAYLIFAVWSEVVANFSAVLVWAVAQELHDARSAKRFFGYIGAGRVLGIALSGLATGGLVRIVGTENLLFVLMAALLGLGALTAVLARRHPLPPPAPTQEGVIEASAVATHPGGSRYLAVLAATTLLLFAALTVGDYQFKAVARSVHQDRDALASFIGLFYAGVGAFGLVVQFGLTRRLLTRFGVVAGLLAMPLAFAISTLGLWRFPELHMASLLKGSDNGLQYTLHEATEQILLFPFAPGARDRARTWISAVCKPFGCAIGACVLLVLAPPSKTPLPGPELIQFAASLGIATFPIALAVLALVPMVRAGYLETMRRSLRRHEIEPAAFENTPAARALLLEALGSQDSPQVIFAVERLREIEPDLVRDALPRLAAHRSARVRALALRLTSELGDPRAPDLARAALSDADDKVRIAAVETLATHLNEDAHDELEALARREHDEPVRTAAIAALVRRCGLDGMLDGAPLLRALLDSTEPAERIAAARVLAMVESASLQRSLARLILDPDAEVRRAAIQAAASVRDARLAPLLADALAEKALGAPAAKALTAIGEGALPELARRLADPQAARAARLRIPRVLWRIGTPAALAVLMTRLDEDDEVIRQKVLASASRLRLLLQAPPAPLPEVRSRIDRELYDHERTRDGYLAVRRAITQPLLEEHLLGRLRKGLIRILRLCELAYPRDVVASVRAHLFGSEPALRANAFEVLESMLEPDLRARLVGLTERFLTLRAGDFTPTTRPTAKQTAAEWVRAEIEHGDSWRAVLALDAVAHHRLQSAGGAVMRAAAHPDALVREAAAIAAAAAQPAGYRELLHRLLDDPDPIVAGYATYWAQTGRTGVDEEDQVYTTVEKVLFLQRVPVFSRVSGEDLVSLARGSVVVSCPRGEVIFREGDRGGALFFVISGSVQLTVGGREVARLGPNDVFGEMSIFDREPRAATSMVVEEAELLRVSAEDFHEAVRETVEIAEAVIQVLNRRLREADRRLAHARSSRVPSIVPGPVSLPEVAASTAIPAAATDESGTPGAQSSDGEPLPSSREPTWEGEPPPQEMLDADLE